MVFPLNRIYRQISGNNFMLFSFFALDNSEILCYNKKNRRCFYGSFLA